MVGHAVVLNHRAVAVGAAVQTFTVTVGQVRGAVDAGEGDAVGELAGWAEQDYLFVDGGRIPVRVGPGAQGDPRQPGGQQVAGFDTHTRRFHLGFGYGAEADEVFDHAGEGGEVVHGADGGATWVGVQ